MTENSKVLALKYRPQVFEDLIGQEIIAETIKNSIISDKSPNAFLFTGIRGVGKTTFARIVAKSLNCEHGIENMCKKKCSNCDAITNSNHIDVLEMDAASKTGVDDVRELIEFSRYGPTTAKYKIFIIDEVHMLSKQAFNALLKTLEEPPKYLKFIFATTEIKKIPVTVISRCQRFDLSRVKSEELFNYIKMIKDKEGGNVSDEAGMPLAGVNIIVQGTSSGTQSDFDGNYSIMVDEGSVLTYSYVGYNSVSEEVGSSNRINVTLSEGEALEEVLVTAYGIARDLGVFYTFKNN